LSIELIGELLRATELIILEADDFPTKAKRIMIGGYFCFRFVVFLRSPEGLLADLKGLIEHYDENRAYVIIPLLGKVIGEHHTRQHSGIHVKLWIGRLIAVHQRLGRTRGPLFLNASGNQATTADINDPFLEILSELYDIQRDLFDVDIRTTADLQEKYNVFRSFRRGSESRAVAKGVSEPDQYVVHRWRKKENAGANKTAHPIDQHYVDVSQVKDSFLRYTQAM
jgi:hypothetical protein